MMTGLVASVLAAVIASEGAADASYVHQIEDWRRQRAQRLTADGGWLTVAGLFWLKPGANRFGADAANEIVLPAHSAPAQAGAFVLEGGRVRVEVRPGAAVTLAGKLVARAELRSDAGGATPDVLALGALTLQIIDRGGRLGVRLKDMKNPARAAFKGLRYFPIDSRFRVVATFVPHEKPVSINVPNVLGMVESMPSPGYASFVLDGAGKSGKTRSRCGSTPCWSRAKRSCSSSSATRRRARPPMAAAGSCTPIRPRRRNGKRQGHPRLQQGLFAAVRVHAARDLSAAAGQQPATGRDRGGGDVRRAPLIRPTPLPNPASRGEGT